MERLRNGHPFSIHPFITQIARGETPEPKADNLDALLHWLAGRDTPATTAITNAFENAGVAPEGAQRLTLLYLDTTLFAHQADPYRLFGLTPECNLDDIRARHKRLMQVFHPDRHRNNKDWFTRRSERINHAYATLKETHDKPTNRTAAGSSSAAPNTQTANPQPRTPAPSSRAAAKPTTFANKTKLRRNLKDHLGNAATLQQRGLAVLFAIPLVLLLVLYFNQPARVDSAGLPVSTSQPTVTPGTVAESEQGEPQASNDTAASALLADVSPPTDKIDDKPVVAVIDRSPRLALTGLTTANDLLAPLPAPITPEPTDRQQASAADSPSTTAQENAPDPTGKPADTSTAVASFGNQTTNTPQEKQAEQATSNEPKPTTVAGNPEDTNTATASPEDQATATPQEHSTTKISGNEPEPTTVGGDTANTSTAVTSSGEQTEDIPQTDTPEQASANEPESSTATNPADTRTAAASPEDQAASTPQEHSTGQTSSNEPEPSTAVTQKDPTGQTSGNEPEPTVAANDDAGAGTATASSGNQTADTPQDQQAEQTTTNESEPVTVTDSGQPATPSEPEAQQESQAERNTDTETSTPNTAKTEIAGTEPSNPNTTTNGRQDLEAINEVLDAYQRAYTVSDIEAFAALFQRNAKTKHAEGRAEIKKKYGEFFRNTRERTLAFTDARIRFLGNRQFKINTRYEAAWRYPDGDTATSSGRFKLHLTPSGDELKIWRLNY